MKAFTIQWWQYCKHFYLVIELNLKSGEIKRVSKLDNILFLNEVLAKDGKEYIDDVFVVDSVVIQSAGKLEKAKTGSGSEYGPVSTKRETFG